MLRQCDVPFDNVNLVQWLVKINRNAFILHVCPPLPSCRIVFFWIFMIIGCIGRVARKPSNFQIRSISFLLDTVVKWLPIPFFSLNYLLENDSVNIAHVRYKIPKLSRKVSFWRFRQTVEQTYRHMDNFHQRFP